MALEQTIDCTIVDVLSNPLLKRLVNDLGGNKLALRGAFDERCQKGRFFVLGQIVVAPAAWSNGFETLRAKPFIE